MSLTDYFENVEGIGILATADPEGNVDLALYARPHVINEDELEFIMADHLSHDNVTTNPHAAYLFLEQGEQGGAEGYGGYNGLRLYLTRTEEETDPKKIEEVRREDRRGRNYSDERKYLVHFKVDGARRLIGD
ncbi:MAG: pyridoxamine 5'-phosphate oxidase family protein [Solirubrobacterales bacterium]